MTGTGTTETTTAEPGTLICGAGYQLCDYDGRLTRDAAIAALWAAISLLRGCLATPIAELAGLEPVAVAEALGGLDTPGAPAAWAETLARLVDDLAAGVPDAVAADVMHQAFALVVRLIVESAVDGVVSAGSSIRLPEDVRFLVNPGEADRLRPAAILAAAFRRATFALSGLVSIAAREAQAPGAPTLH